MALTRITAQQISDSDFKQSVRVVNTTNTNLTGGAPKIVDGVTLALNDRILVVGQSTASQNGLYNVSSLGTGSNGTWIRTSDGNATGEISSGMIVVATEGTAYGDSEWLLTTDDPIIIGSTSLSFIQLNATIYNGTSNVAVLNNGNVSISSAGTANVAVISADGVYVNSNLYVSTNAVITGNLTVNGTTTTINSNTITTNDKTITVANNQSTGTGVDGAGFDAGGGTPIATWRYNNTTTSWQSNVGITPSANASLALGGTSNYWGTAYITTASVTGNVTGGNVVTSGAMSATGNITGSYILGNGSQLTGLPATYGNANVATFLASYGSNTISTTGNVTAGYLLGNGSQLTGLPATYGNANVVANLAALGSNPVSTTGNITAGNLITGNGSGGNLSGANVISSTTLIATANIIGGNILTAGIISATGNITGNYIVGNGSQLTGLPASYGNANVVANLAALGSNPISTTGNISANYFAGNGSQLTGITGANVTGTVANATYAVSSGSATTAGTVTTAAQANITSVGILTSLSVTGNVTGGNVTGTNLYGTLQTPTQLNVTGLGTLTTLIVSGNTTSGNLLTGGVVSATGNITGNYILGNGSQLTGLPASYGNANVVANLAALGSNPVSTTGNITGNYIIGNGSQLTGLPASYGNANVVANLAALGSNPISTTGNITAGNLITGNGSGGNLTGANVISAVTLSASGNVTGNYILGNGALLTGVITSVANINAGNSNVTVVSSGGNVSVGVGGTANVAVFATTGEYVTGVISASGNITGGNVISNGIRAYKWTTVANTAPSDPVAGDNWYDSYADKKYQYTYDGVNSFWVDQSFPSTYASLTVTGNTSVGNLSTSGTISAVGDINTSGNMRALNFNSASADLAEMYVADQNYAPGTVVEFGGTYEITASKQTHSSAVAGIISTQPSYLMNSSQTGEHVLPVALTGRVPCQVVGKIRKGDRLVASDIPGVAIALDHSSWIPGCIIGKSLEVYDSDDVGIIEVAVGRT